MIGVDMFVVAAFERSMRGDENAVVEDANLVGEDVDVEDAAARRVRHAVEIAADAHHALVRDASFELQDCPIRREWQRLQRGLLLGKGFVDDALRGRVDAWVRNGVEPMAELRVEIIEVAERAAEEEVLADVPERPRYLKVDPDNRLVADALEADWNDRLRQLDTLQREHERQRATDRGLLSEEARARILSLAKDFHRVWNDPRTAPIERKRMVALLIEDVTLVKADKIAIHVRFRGGKTTSLAIDKPKPIALIRKTLPEVVRTVDELLETCTDRQVAARLNELGYRNWRGQSFTAKKIIVIRMAYRLKSRFERLRGRGMGTPFTSGVARAC